MNTKTAIDNILDYIEISNPNKDIIESLDLCMDSLIKHDNTKCKNCDKSFDCEIYENGMDDEEFYCKNFKCDINKLTPQQRQLYKVLNFGRKENK